MTTKRHFDNDVQESIYRNNHKLTADKIKQKLSEVKNERTKSRRRWIWELMQNAKDVPNPYGGVSINIHFTNGALIFSHNGDPFYANQITGLIQQVSTKRSDAGDEKTTGKFGTGFISTHLLSDIINVRGIVKRTESIHREFEITLDRSGDTSEDLLPNIESNLERIVQLDSSADFREIPMYLEQRTENDYDTRFEYPLIDIEAKKAAEVGVSDLVNTLHYTMVNVDQIKKVTVINDLTNEIDVYHKVCLKNEEYIDIIQIQVDKNNQPQDPYTILRWKEEEIHLLVRVEAEDNYSLIPLTGKEPYLYRDFPLIGTEKFHFPFVVNGLTFYPTEKRDGLLLNDNSSEPEHNKDLLLSAFRAGIKFTDWLIANDAQNLFVLANTRIPNYGPLEPETTQWFKNFQKTWRNKILGKKMVECGTKNICIKDALFPRSNNSQLAEDHTHLFDLSFIFIGQDKLPIKNIHEKWLKSLGPLEEKDSWGMDLLLDEISLLKLIESCNNLDQLHLLGAPAYNSISKTQWLNKVFSFLESKKIIELILPYKVIPNQKGDLNKLEKLWWESLKEPIPDEILNVLELIELDWRSELIHRKIGFHGMTKQERTLSDASTAINNFISKSQKQIMPSGDFLKHPKCINILIGVLQLVTTNYDLQSFRCNVFKYAKELLHFADDLKTLEKLEGLNFSVASKWLAKYINSTISKTETIDVLANTLSKTKDQAIIWLDNYLRFLERSGDNSVLLKEGNIVPNRNNKFSAFDSLYNFGTEERPLNTELLKLLQQFDNKQNWFPKLVADGIGIKLPEAYKFEELAKSIKVQVDSIQANDQYENYRDQLLSLISWCNERKNKELAKIYLSEFLEKANRIFFILSVEKSGHGDAFIQLMKNPEKLPELLKIIKSGIDLKDITENLPELLKMLESGIDFKDITEISDIVKDPAQKQKVLEYARQLKEEKSDFDFKRRIGEAIENYFKEALETVQLNAEVKYRGSGSHDFVIRNIHNQKEFFIELKSHKNGDKQTPIKLAISQARLAVSDSARFGLCIIERPTKDHHDIVGYIKNNLQYLGGLKLDFETVVTKANELEKIIRDSSSISIELKDKSYLVKVSHEYIAARKKAFQELIQKIKSAIE